MKPSNKYYNKWKSYVRGTHGRWGGVGVGVNVCGDYSVGNIVFPMTRINDNI